MSSVHRGHEIAAIQGSTLLSLGNVRPTGALFVLDPTVSITEDQAGALAITNASSLAVFTDDVNAANPKAAIQYVNDGALVTTGTPIADYSAALPFTMYAAYRLSELDSGLGPLLGTLYSDGSNYCGIQFIGGDEIRARVTATAGTGVKDTNFNIPGQSIYVIAVTFYSLTECRISVDDSVGSIVAYSASRDPSNFVELVIGGLTSLTNEVAGELFEFDIYPADIDQAVCDYMRDEYSPTWLAGSDLSFSGTCEFDWRPVKTGDYTNSRDVAGVKLWPTVVNGYFGIGTTGGVAHAKPSAAADEMLLWTYPGSATLNACASDTLLILVAFKVSGTGVQDLIAVGDNVSTGDRLYLTVDTTTGDVDATYEDSGGGTHTVNGGTVSLSAVVVVALEAVYGAGTGTIGCAVNAGSMTRETNAVTSNDITLSNLILGGQYSAKTTGTADAVFLGCAVLEGETYTADLATDFLNSVT